MWWVLSSLAVGVAVALGMSARGIGGAAVYPFAILAALIGATASVYALRLGRGIAAVPAAASLVQSWAWPLAAIGSAVGAGFVAYLLDALIGTPLLAGACAVAGVAIGRVLDERLL